MRTDKTTVIDMRIKDKKKKHTDRRIFLGNYEKMETVF